MSLELVNKAVKLALSLGAEEAHCSMAASRGLRVELEADTISRAAWHVSRRLSITTVIGGRIGFASTRDLSPEAVKRAVEDSVKLARSVTRNPDWRGLPSPRPYPSIEGVFDARVAEADPVEIVGLAEKMLEAAKAYDKRVSIMGGIVETEVNRVAVANSNGIEGVDEGTLASAQLIAVAKEAGETGSFAFEDVVKRSLNMDVEEVGREAARKAVESLRAKQAPSFKGPVIMDFHVSAMIFSALASAYNGDMVRRGSSPLRDRLGDTVTVDEVTVVDDGLLPGGVNTSRFDAEGSPRQRTVVVEKGVLKTYIHNTFTARALGHEPTGNAVSLLSVAPSNTVVKPGDFNLEEMIEDVDRGLLVGRFSGRISFQDGVVSGTAKQSWLIENGELAYPVRECMVSGNLYEFLNSITALGKEARNVDSLVVPRIRVEGVAVIGGQQTA